MPTPIRRLLRGAGPVRLWSAVVFAVLAVFGIMRHQRYQTAGYDLGIFDQAMLHYSHLKAPYVALKGPHYNLLGDHFHPIVAVLTPLYWIWSDPRMLLLAQAALIAVSVPVVHRVAARHLSPRVALAWTFGYGAGWPLQAMMGFDFHEVAFAVPLLALALDALDRTPNRRADRQLWLWCVLLLLVREDMGVLVAAIGLLRVLRGDAGRATRWRGLAILAAGVAAYLLTTKVLIPHFNPGGFSYWDYDALGPNLSSALGHIVAHPIETARLFFVPDVKTKTLVWLLIPWLFLSLRSPYVIVVIPLLAQRFLSAREHLWYTSLHYNAPEWPILAIAAIDGARRLRLATWWRGRAMAVVSAWVVVMPIVGLIAYPSVFPAHRLFDGDSFELTAHERDQAALLAQIPPSTCVEADDHLIPHLTHTNLVSIPGYLGRDPDFYALDTTFAQPNELSPPTLTIGRRALARGYTIVGHWDGLVLLRRPGYAGPSPGCGPFGEG